MATYSTQLTKEQLTHFKKTYEQYKIEKAYPYIINKYKYHNITIALYFSLKVVFQGSDEKQLLTEYEKWALPVNINEQINVIGSDESGVGDFFGPLVVTACYIAKKDWDFVKSLKIRDSKTLSTIQINILAQQLINELQYETIIINNRQYNKLYDTYKNSHILKTIGHHQVIRKLATRTNCQTAIIDQFVNRKKYYEYLEILNVNENNLKLVFTTHAENKYIAVGCAAIISRYFFLKQIKQLEKEFQQTLPLGANKEVDDTIIKIISNNKANQAINYAKLHFINWKKANDKENN